MISLRLSLNRHSYGFRNLGIRWGLDEETAQGFGLPGSRQNTWEFGIERDVVRLCNVSPG
ncbi:exodeoxyribonuclease V subunit gamma [Vibrio sp. PP-XX7]